MRRGSRTRPRRSSASSTALLAFEPKAGEPARPRRLIEAMRYATLGGGKRLRPFLDDRDGAGARATDDGPSARGRGDRMHPRLFADPRRSAGDGRRRPAARPADRPTAPSTRRRRFSPATRCRRWRSRSWPIPRPTRAPRRARRALRRSRPRRGPGRHGRRADARHRRRDRRRRRCRSTEIARLQAMKTGALSGSASRRARGSAGAGGEARAALSTLRARDRRRVPDRRRHARRRKRHGDARQARRQGRRRGTRATLVAALGLDGARRELDRLVDEGERRGRRGRSRRKAATCCRATAGLSRCARTEPFGLLTAARRARVVGADEVAEAARGLDDVDAELLAQAPDEHLDRIRIAVEILLVEMLDDLACAR